MASYLSTFFSEVLHLYQKDTCYKEQTMRRNSQIPNQKECTEKKSPLSRNVIYDSETPMLMKNGMVPSNLLYSG